MNRIKHTLKQIWGYDELRSPQGEIIQCLLDRHDALIVMPTGGGKSLCFQLPALLSDGLTLVISPLVALMENQVQELTEKKLPVGLLHSELPKAKRQRILEALTARQLKLLYLSPETLLSEPVWSRLCASELQIDRLILDEAHCLVHWGETFRPAYRRLGAVRAVLNQSQPETKIAIAAFTATADPHAQQTIARVLQLDKPVKFILDPYRQNLQLAAQYVWTPRGRRDRLLKFIREHPRQSGLIYVRTRQTSEELAAQLQATGDRTLAYHAGLSPTARRRVERDWADGTLQYVVCTCAFGMGINKADVRWVAHFQPPVLLAEYIQEIGRAGRDGKPAKALLLTCEPTGWFYPEDRQRHRFFTEQIDRDYRLATTLSQQLPVQGKLADIEREFPQSAIALSLLHATGKLVWETPFEYRRARTRLPDWHILKAQQRSLDRQIEDFIKYRGCRWQYLLTAFGSQSHPPTWHCGKCDRCCRHS